MEHDSDSDWVTFYTTYNRGLGAIVATQKHPNGNTRSVVLGRREIDLINQLFGAEPASIAAHHDLELFQAA